MISLNDIQVLVSSMEKHIIKKESFKVNGKTYDSFDQLPEKFKKLLDRDGNGKADMLEELENKVTHQVEQKQHDSVSPEGLLRNLAFVMIIVGAIVLYNYFF